MSARNFLINSGKRRFGNVTINREFNRIGVQLHSTEVVVAQNGTITLDTGGWSTVTTKSAINLALRQLFPRRAPSVFSENGEWFVSFPVTVPGYDAYVVEFIDGMTFRLTEKGYLCD